MAIQWMDNFNIYGTDAGNAARMLNGPYAEATGALAVDPDATAGGSLVAYQPFLRRVLSAARTTVGLASRNWLGSLPSSVPNQAVFAEFRDQNNVRHGYLAVDPSGFLRYYRTDNGVDVLLGSSANPVIVANAWQHTETKIFLDAAAGTVEVRVEGIAVLTVAATRTTTNVGGAIASCQNVIPGYRGSGGSPSMYVKDFIVWDNTGALNNNFMGSCQVLKIIPNGDVALNWTPSSGVTGYNLINEVTPDDDVNYISAPTPAPAAYKCSLSDLPVTVTTVRGVMPIHRSRKTDGGDGNIQIGLISGGATGLGADRPITTAYTYWSDIFDADPNTAGAWSRVAVNALNLQINRSL